jgi:hypothetical protein
MRLIINPDSKFPFVPNRSNDMQNKHKLLIIQGKQHLGLRATVWQSLCTIPSQSQQSKTKKERTMSIQKKSLISNRNATKKANLTKASVHQVSSTKTSKLPVALIRPKIQGKLHVAMVHPKLSIY